MSKDCDVCAGTPGRYPVFNKHGTELYSIQCPECGGSGVHYPASSASRVKTVDEAREVASAQTWRNA